MGAGWYPDPLDRSRLRYWDGVAWTLNVGYDGKMWSAPLGGAVLPPPLPQPPPTTWSPPTPAWPGAPAGYTPVPVGYALPQAATATFAPLHGLATALSWLFGAAAFASLLSVLARVNERFVLQRIRNGDDAVDDSRVSDVMVGLTSFLRAALVVAIASVLMVFLYRATRNVRAFGREPRWGPGWAIGAWFIPFANFVIPYQVTVNARRGASPGQYGEDPVPGVYTAWWLLFVAGELLSQVGGFHPSKDVDSLMTINLAAIASAVAFGTSALLAIGVVRDIARAQHERAGR
jgi:hypothetical protein